MERLSDLAIAILNELHTDRLEYHGEYLPLIEALNRLSAYEDLGQEPEELAEHLGEMKTAYDENGIPYSLEASGAEAKHIIDLLEAERHNLLVCLPCYFDDPIFLIRGEKERRKKMRYIVEKCYVDHFTIGCAKIPMITACSEDNEWESLIDGTKCGQEYWLNPQEAEHALKDMGDDRG